MSPRFTFQVNDDGYEMVQFQDEQGGLLWGVCTLDEAGEAFPEVPGVLIPHGIIQALYLTTELDLLLDAAAAPATAGSAPATALQRETSHIADAFRAGQQ